MTRDQISPAISLVLNAAEAVGIEYSDALGFFERLDWELISTGVYGAKQIEHALRYGARVDDRMNLCESPRLSAPESTTNAALGCQKPWKAYWRVGSLTTRSATRTLNLNGGDMTYNQSGKINIDGRQYLTVG